MDIDLGATKLLINPSTEADVLLAFKNSAPFPDRDIVLGEVSAQYSSGTIPLLPDGSGLTLSATFSAEGSSGLSVFSSAAKVLQSLKLDSAAMPDVSGGTNDRFLVLSFQAAASAVVGGKVPVGVIGAVTFGVKPGASTQFIVISRFEKNTSALAALKSAFTNVKLPKQVRTAEDLSAGVWVIAEVDGSLGLTLGAQVGYNLTYTRDLPQALQLAKLKDDLSVKVDAAAQASVAYNVSGRYLVVVGRPSTGPSIDLVVSKGSSYGYNFGLNLSAGVQMENPLPANGRDLFAASFGLLGPQIVNDVSDAVATLEAWSTGDLAANTAALTISTAKKLLSATTGIDADTGFQEATNVLKTALSKWNDLIQQGSRSLQTLAWKALGDPTEKALLLRLLSDLKENNSFNKAVSDGLQFVSGQAWLMSISEVIGASSVLSLGDKQADVQKIAAYALDVLDGDASNVLSRLKTYISDRFRILADEKLSATGANASDPVGEALAIATNPGKLNQWLQDRLAAVLKNNTLLLADLQQVQSAVKQLGTKFNDLYAITADALSKKYNFAFAAKYNSTTESATLLNLSFDLASAGAAALYTRVLDGDTASIFRQQAPHAGLTIHAGIISHGIHRSGTTNLTIPYLATASEDITNSVAQLAFERNGSNLAGYLKSSNEVDRDRYSSILRLAATFNLQASALASTDSSLAYELRVTAAKASASAVEQATSAFVSTYLGDRIAGTKYRDKLLADFDLAVPSPTSEMGDMLMSMQVAVDGVFLDNWIVTKERLLPAQIAASRVVQQSLRTYTHRLFFSEKGVNSADAQALLVWESFPVCSGIVWNENAGVLSATNTGRHFYLNGETAKDRLLRALINSTVASGADTDEGDWGRLTQHITSTNRELVQRGIAEPAFISLPATGAANRMVRYVLLDPAGQRMIQALAFAEGQAVHGVAAALAEMSVANGSASSSDRSHLPALLAKFGADLTEALNEKLSDIFERDALRQFGPLLFVELTKALTGGNPSIRTKAMLELKSLKPQHTFPLDAFVKGTEPTPDQIAVSQTIVNL